MNFEVWENIGGTILKNLFKDPRYPDNPDKAQTLPSFSTPPNRGDNYGARVTGYYQVNTHSREGIITMGLWWRNRQGKRLSPLRSLVRISVRTRHIHVRRVSQRSAESRGFSPGTPVPPTCNVDRVCCRSRTILS